MCTPCACTQHYNMDVRSVNVTMIGILAESLNQQVEIRVISQTATVPFLLCHLVGEMRLSGSSTS